MGKEGGGGGVSWVSNGGLFFLLVPFLRPFVTVTEDYCQAHTMRVEVVKEACLCH